MHIPQAPNFAFGTKTMSFVFVCLTLFLSPCQCLINVWPELNSSLDDCKTFILISLILDFAVLNPPSKTQIYSWIFTSHLQCNSNALHLRFLIHASSLIVRHPASLPKSPLSHLTYNYLLAILSTPVDCELLEGKRCLILFLYIQCLIRTVCSKHSIAIWWLESVWNSSKVLKMTAVLSRGIEEE